jgi:hypothetical protein
MGLKTLKGRQHEFVAWVYTICWCLSALTSIMSLIYARAEKHKWNPLALIVLSVVGFLRHIAVFVFGGLSFLLTLYVLEIDEGENFMPGFVTTCVPMMYYLYSISSSRRRLQSLKKDA